MKVCGYWTQDDIDMAKSDVPELAELSDEEFQDHLQQLQDAGFLTWNGSVYLLTIPDYMEE
jgi:CRP-like cAMP-binding protein